MISTLLSGPAAEPLALADARAWLRLETGDEDRLVSTLIAAARAHVESVLSVALVPQQWRLWLDDWPASGIVRLPVRPLRQVIALTVFGPDGTARSLPVAGCRITTGGAAELHLPPAWATSGEGAGLEIDYEAGFDDVPPDLGAALLQLVAHWYNHRDAVLAAGTGAILPDSLGVLLAPWRPARL